MSDIYSNALQKNKSHISLGSHKKQSPFKTELIKLLKEIEKNPLSNFNDYREKIKSSKHKFVSRYEFYYHANSVYKKLKDYEEKIKSLACLIKKSANENGTSSRRNRSRTTKKITNEDLTKIKNSIVKLSKDQFINLQQMIKEKDPSAIVSNNEIQLKRIKLPMLNAIKKFLADCDKEPKENVSLNNCPNGNNHLVVEDKGPKNNLELFSPSSVSSSLEDSSEESINSLSDLESKFKRRNGVISDFNSLISKEYNNEDDPDLDYNYLYNNPN